MVVDTASCGVCGFWITSFVFSDFASVIIYIHDVLI